MPSKKHSDYSDKLIIADASPLIVLNQLAKIDYLQKLFKIITTTKTVKSECRFKLPKWIVIEEPKEYTKGFFKKYPFDRGELSAIALAH